MNVLCHDGLEPADFGVARSSPSFLPLLVEAENSALPQSDQKLHGFVAVKIRHGDRAPGSRSAKGNLQRLGSIASKDQEVVAVGEGHAGGSGLTGKESGS